MSRTKLRETKNPPIRRVFLDGPSAVVGEPSGPMFFARLATRHRIGKHRA
ncbi:hypothetical protein [Lysobacter gummosus]